MLYKALTDKSIYLLIMTQDKSVGDKLADLNNRSKITALPSAVNNPEAPMGTAFDWKSMLWDTALLTKYLKRLDNERNAAIFEDKNEQGELYWLDGPMTPHNARWKRRKFGTAFNEELKKDVMALYADTSLENRMKYDSWKAMFDVVGYGIVSPTIYSSWPTNVYQLEGPGVALKQPKRTKRKQQGKMHECRFRFSNFQTRNYAAAIPPLIMLSSTVVKGRIMLIAT